MIELAIAMALSVLTAFAVTSAVTTAVNAGLNYQARQSETNAGLAIAGIIKNDFKKAFAATWDGDYLQISVTDETDLMAGEEFHYVIYRFTGGDMLRGESAEGVAPDTVGLSNVKPELPGNLDLTIDCPSPCGVAYDVNGADALVTGKAPVRFVFTNLSINVDGTDKFSALFDTDAATYQLPELAFFFPAGGEEVADSVVDATASAYVDPTDTSEAADKEAADAVTLACASDALSVACLGGGGHGGGGGGGGGMDAEG
ncbi:MAG: hypothetical protein QE263_00415 [Vampirovibrionales bacterium]|nr:hypothetical protein [Vampirovibrionales bacterium]